jgi:SAM-dependent methyltransferase
MSADEPDRWAAGAAYEPFVGRWSRPIARAFLERLAIRPRSAWADIGCGTGAVTDTILTIADPARVDAFDPSAGFIAYAREHVRDARAAFGMADARALPLQDATVDAVVSGLMLNFVPQPDTALTEMVRIVRPGGVVAAYVWDYREGMQLIRKFWDVAAILDSDAVELDEGRRFPLCEPSALRVLFEGAGLLDTETFAIEVPTRFRDFDDYWTPFLGRQGPAPGYVGRLDEPRRRALRSRLQATLPTNADGSIELTARAWAVRGSKG